MAKGRVAVIGAGAFGGWTALTLLRRGAAVTLLDARGPGNPMASSGGETRVIRGTYGPDQPYTQMSARAMQLWDQEQKSWKRKVFHRAGVLWMAAAADDQFERSSLASLDAAKIPYQRLSVSEVGARWPQINLEGIHWAIYEPESGFIEAQAACEEVCRQFVVEGGVYQQETVDPCETVSGEWLGAVTQSGSELRADHFVFACGAWLGTMFPSSVGDHVRVTKQDVFFFAAPNGDGFSCEKLPVWADHRDHFVYGIPGSPGAAFKIADDTRGPAFDPTHGDRTVSEAGLQNIRQYLEFRFPSMKGAPLIGTRVCQYEDTPDHHFIVDRHPVAKNVWIAGGGSGHGFKHGPVIGEIVADWILQGKEADPRFRLGRFAK